MTDLSSSSARVPVFRASAPVPPVVGGFRIVSALESSVLGRTFRAMSSSGTAVVLTLLERDEPALRERVAAVLGLLATIDHPCIARVAGQGIEGEHHYYALQVPDCVSLLDLVKRGRPLDGSEVVWLGGELASALATLHARGLAHGDVTPVNVGVTAEGRAVLADLGWSPRVRDAAFDTKVADASLADVGQLAATLAFGTTGQPIRARASGRLSRSGVTAAPGPRLSERATWLTREVAELLETLLEAEGRQPAAFVAEKLRSLAKDVGLEAWQAPRDLVDTSRRLLFESEADLKSTTSAGTTSPGLSGTPAPALGAFGRYVLIQEIARGGMGVVYRARHAELDRLFALKVLLGDAASEVTRKRFLREAEAAAQLDHPSIVRVHDFGEHDGRAYIAMDFAEGRSLSSTLAEDAYTDERLLGVFAKACDAVHYAHSRGIIHRDLKPQNIVVDAKDVPHILDFGVAKRLDENARGAGRDLTTEGELVGTPAYMPPEQAEGRAKDIDTRSDVYALGVILYELSTRGRLPFEGLTVTDVLTKVLLDDAPAPSSRRPDLDLPWEIDAIALKAIEKDPRRRYQSAAELAQDVRLFLEGRPIGAKRATALYRARKWALRNRRALPFVGVAALAVAALPLWALHVSRRNRELEREKVEELVARADALLADQASPEQREAKLKQAREAYTEAWGRDSTSQPAFMGKVRAEYELKQIGDRREAEARATTARESARKLVATGAECLARKDAEGARRAFTQALAFDRESQEAQDGLYEARFLERQASEQKDAERRRAEAERQAREKVQEGEAALGRGDAEAARRAFFQALAFSPDGEGAQAGLRKAERLAFEADAQKQRERNAAEAARLIAAGREKLAARDYAGARADFTQALAFDGQNQDALAGLSGCEKVERDFVASGEKRKKRAEADEILAEGDGLLAKARDLAKQDADATQVRDAYIAALEAYDRASYLSDEVAPKKKKATAAGELAVHARNHQDWGLAQLMFRIAGTSSDAATDQAPAVQDDDCLVAREADAIQVQRAFREPMSFDEKASKEFLKDVRALVEAKKERFRLLVDIRTRAVAGPNPVVYLVGFDVRLQDLKANTTSAVEKIELEPTAYQRIVVAGTSGRVVPSVDKALANDAPAVLERVKERARALLAAAEKK